jgi:hypothetical protein
MRIQALSTHICHATYVALALRICGAAAPYALSPVYEATPREAESRPSMLAAMAGWALRRVLGPGSSRFTTSPRLSSGHSPTTDWALGDLAN